MFRIPLHKALAAIGAAVLLVPAAAAAKPAQPKGKGKGSERSGQTVKKGKGKSQNVAKRKGKAKRKGADKPKNAVFEGFVGDVDVQARTVEVEVDAGNRWARPFVDETVVFDLSNAKIEIAEDLNGDGVRDLEDAEGADVLVQARLVRGSSRQPFAAHQFIVFAYEEDDSDSEDADDDDVETESDDDV